MFSPILSFFLMPLISMISRHNEYAADNFGSNLATKEDLVTALLNLQMKINHFHYHILYISFLLLTSTIG